MMTTKLRKSVAIVVSAAMLIGLSMPPAYAHTHSSAATELELHEAPGPHGAHAHPQRHQRDASHTHHGIEHPPDIGGRHVHWHVLFLDFTFPASSEQDGGDDGGSALAVLQKSPAPAGSSAGLVLLPLIGMDGSPSVNADVIGSDHRGRSAACPGLARPVCDTARLARSGVLIA